MNLNDLETNVEMNAYPMESTIIDTPDNHDNDETDPNIIEVDVYIAYGLYEQAISELIVHTKQTPENMEYRFKLIECYFLQKDYKTFNQEVEKFISMDGVNSNPDFWVKIEKWIKETPPPVQDTPSIVTALQGYKQLHSSIKTNQQFLMDNQQQLTDVRQQISVLTTPQNTSEEQENTENQELDTCKNHARNNDCNNIIHYVEQIRECIVSNTTQAEALLLPMSQNMDLLKLRIRHIRLLETLLSAQKTELKLKDQKQQADICIQQLTNILKGE
jgi:ubiquitin